MMDLQNEQLESLDEIVMSYILCHIKVISPNRHVQRDFITTLHGPFLFHSSSSHKQTQHTLIYHHIWKLAKHGRLKSMSTSCLTFKWSILETMFQESLWSTIIHQNERTHNHSRLVLIYICNTDQVSSLLDPWN